MIFCAPATATGEGAFVCVPAGNYLVGRSDRLDNPRRTVRLRSFEISKYDVTNRDFMRFVSATGYRTDAERYHAAMVFRPPLPEFRWIRDGTASWRFPNGTRMGGISGKESHPVTTISFRDAQAYCAWAKVRLPSLEEWEVASRAGSNEDYFFGADPGKIGVYANIWHRPDHLKPDSSDGFVYTSPVGTFKPNRWGLYDIYGNVFQFCTGRLPSDRKKEIAHARGGSWWCSKHACCYFNSVDIGTVSVYASFSNQGFRVVKLAF